MMHSGSVCNIITKLLAKSILKTTPTARLVASTDERDLKTFSNEPIKDLGKLTTTVTQNDWTCEDACLTVVDDGYKNVIGRYLFSSLGLTIVQQQSKKSKCVITIDTSTCKVKQAVASQFTQLDSRIGLSQTFIVKSKFHEMFTAKHQKVRRVSIS